MSYYENAKNKDFLKLYVLSSLTNAKGEKTGQEVPDSALQDMQLFEPDESRYSEYRKY